MQKKSRTTKRLAQAFAFALCLGLFVSLTHLPSADDAAAAATAAAAAAGIGGAGARLAPSTAEAASSPRKADVASAVAATPPPLPPPTQQSSVRMPVRQRQPLRLSRQLTAAVTLPPADNPEDPDYLPFDVDKLPNVWAIVNRLPPEFYALPPVAAAPTGAEALAVARAQGFPDVWRARMRPRFFVLGPVAAGTLLLHECYQKAMKGDPALRPYPTAQERWPLSGGQPYAFEMPREFQVWNRTGPRRLDPRREWGVYDKMHWSHRAGLTHHHLLRFPPVEEESRDWALLDATPTYLMSAGAAERAKQDLEDAPFQPVFLVLLPDALVRGYEHFRSATGGGGGGGGGGDKVFEYSVTLGEQMRTGPLAGAAVCREMLQHPEKLMEDIRRVRHALEVCMYPSGSPVSGFNYLPMGFVALGLRYWLHTFDNNATLFRVAGAEDLREASADGVMDLLGGTFGVRRLPPQCDPAAEDGQQPVCTEAEEHRAAVEACTGQRDEQALRARGHERLKEFEPLVRRWEAVLDDLVKAHRIERWMPPVSRAARKGDGSLASGSGSQKS